ncbi:MAG: hypothetical protein IJ068_00225 [Bacilli bacterium]|nr:hypothetical protein [Bacilli bacterium]
MTNEDKVKSYKKRKLFRYLIIIFSFLVVVLESFALFNVISYLWGLIPFVFSCIFKYLNELEMKKKGK